MKKLILTIAFTVLSGSTASAGQIFGSLNEGGRPLVNVYFEVACTNERSALKGKADSSEKSIPKGKTDNYGAYSINVGRGRCIFKLYYKKEILEFGLYSYDRALRYDLEVVFENGAYKLRRR